MSQQQWCAGRRPAWEGRQATVALTAITALFLVESVIAVIPGALPASLNAPLFNLLLNLFVIVHALSLYRVWDVVTFYVVTLVVSFTLENIGVLTGFPFGPYYYSDALGPKLGEVPILIGFSYVGAAYASWVMALILLRVWSSPLRGSTVFFVPFFAAIFMVMWDLTFDPANSTIQQWWIWGDGGAYFGVPISNFAGWYLTVFVFMLIFAWYLRVTGGQASAASPPVSRVVWLSAALVYMAMGMRWIPIESIVGANQVLDGAGQAWNQTAIIQSLGLITVFTMWAVGALAIYTIFNGRSARDNAPTMENVGARGGS
jgi:uncharacterized membrane protein